MCFSPAICRSFLWELFTAAEIVLMLRNVESLSASSGNSISKVS
jgi:hypothetical protein